MRPDRTLSPYIFTNLLTSKRSARFPIFVQFCANLFSWLGQDPSGRRSGPLLSALAEAVRDGDQPSGDGGDDDFV